jgi:hypothetical protein
MEEGDIVDVVAGSAANEAVLASRQSVVTISVRFMGVSFPVSEVRCTRRARLLSTQPAKANSVPIKTILRP